MRVDLSIEMRDEPGELVRALEPVSETGGNIVSVVHHREKQTARGTLPVELELEVEESKLDALLDAMRERDIQVINVGHNRLREKVSVILIGHILHRGLQDTIDRIDDTGYAEVIDMALEMPGVEEASTARLGIRTESGERAGDVLGLLGSIAEEKELTLIKDVEAPA